MHSPPPAFRIRPGTQTRDRAENLTPGNRWDFVEPIEPEGVRIANNRGAEQANRRAGQ